MYIRYFVIFYLWKRTGLFIWTISSLHHPRMLCAKFGWNWTSGSGIDDFYILNVFSLFRNYLPLKKCEALHLRKLEFSSPMFGWNWPSGSGEEDFWIASINFHYFVIIFSLLKGGALFSVFNSAIHYNITLIWQASTDSDSYRNFSGLSGRTR